MGCILCEHTFAISAYGKSPYLAACIESVLNQRGMRSEVYIATSSPSDWLLNVANTYGLPLHVNEGEHGIGPDWNFAYSKATGRFVTIAHQDDIYCSDYAASAVSRLGATKGSLIYFCDYGELRDGTVVVKSPSLMIKRLLLAPLLCRRAGKFRLAKRAPIAIGNSICCPSVCFNKEILRTPPFDGAMDNALDWDCWERLSREKGAFCYAPRIHMYHRIHEESATSKNILNNSRANEDLAMLRRFWPAPVANVLNKAYAHGMDSNEL